MSQAVAAPNTGELNFVSGKCADLATASRRALLTSLIAAPIAVSAAPAQAAIYSEWKAALAIYRAIDAAWNHFLATTYNPAVAELERRAPVPPSGFTVTARSGKKVVYTHDTANPDMWANSVIPAISKPGKRLADQWAEWRERRAQTEAELCFRQIDEVDDRYSKELYAARNRLIAATVDTAAELLEKLEVLWEDGIDADTFKDEVFRDLRRLAA